MTYRPGPGVASVLVRHDDESVANDGDEIQTAAMHLGYGQLAVNLAAQCQSILETC